MGRLNIKLIVGLSVLLVLIGGGTYALHYYQVRRTSRSLLARADSFEQRGDFEQAANYLKGYLGYVPSDRDAIARYGLILAKGAKTAEDRRQALSALDRAVRLKPDRQDLRRKLVELAMRPELKGQVNPLVHVNALLAASPRDGEIWDLRAICEEARGSFTDARTCYAKAIEFAPQRVEPYERYARLLRDRLDDRPGADKVMGELVAKNARSHRAYLQRAGYRASAKQAGVSEDLGRARELAPEDAEVLLASARFEMGQPQVDASKARGYLASGLKSHPRDWRLYRELAQLELNGGEPQKAIDLLRRGLEAVSGTDSPDGAESRRKLDWTLAEILIQADKAKEARDAIDRLRKEGVTPELLRYLEAGIAAREGKWPEAARSLEEITPYLTSAPELSGLAGRAFVLLGQCYEQRGEPDKQYSAYRRAVSIDPTDLAARLGLASALTVLGKVDEAIDEYGAVARKQPGVLIALARLLIQRELQVPPAQRRCEKATQALDEAERVMPELVDIPILRAEVLAAQGDLEGAERRLREACEANSGRVEPWVVLAALAEQRGSPGEALAVLDAAQQKLGDRAELRLARVAYWAGRGGADATRALARLAEGLEHFDDADQHRILRGLAGAYRQAGEVGEAERLLKRVAERWKDDLASRLVLFDLALKEGQVEKIKQAEEGIKVVEGEDGVLWRFARALRSMKTRPKDEAALAQAGGDLLAVSARRPGWSRVALAQAELDELKGDGEAAVKDYLRAINELGERSPSAIRRASQLLLERRRYQDADQVVRKLQDRDLVSRDLQRLASDVSVRAGDYGRALELALRAVPKDTQDYRDLIWLGQVFGAAGKTGEAEATLRRAVTLAADQPDAWVALVLFLAASGQKSQAETAVREAEGALPKGQATLALAQCHEAIGQADRARDLYRVALAARPDDVAALRASTDLDLRSGRLSEAESQLRKIIELQTARAEDKAWARRLLPMILAAGGDYQKSKEALSRLGIMDDGRPVAPQRGESTDDLRDKAKVLALSPSRDRRRDAIKLLEAISEREPPSGDDRFLLAQLLESVGNWIRSREQMRALLTANEKGPLYPTYLAYFAGRLLVHDEPAEAALWADKLSELDPASFRTAALRARVLKAQRREAEAVVLLAKYARDHGSEAGRVAAVLEDLGQFAAAEELFRKNASDSRRPEAAFALAGFLARRGRTKDALDVCESKAGSTAREVLVAAGLEILYASQPDEAQARRVENWIEDLGRRNAGSAQTIFFQANLRSRQGRYREAEDLYRRSMELDKRNTGPMNNLSWLLAVNDGKGAEALDLINRAIAVQGPRPGLLDTRAVAYLAMGRSEDAIKDLQDALALAPTAVGHFHLAQAWLKASNPAAAVAEFRTALDLKLNANDLHPNEQKDLQRLRGELARNR